MVRSLFIVDERHRFRSSLRRSDRRQRGRLQRSGGDWYGPLLARTSDLRYVPGHEKTLAQSAQECRGGGLGPKHLWLYLRRTNRVRERCQQLRRGNLLPRGRGGELLLCAAEIRRQ